MDLDIRVSIDTTVRSVLSAHAKTAVPVEKLADDDDLFAAGMTSHASVNVMLALEDTFDIEFPEQMLRKSTFASVSAISAALEELAGA
jgi:acyl carrier protein